MNNAGGLTYSGFSSLLVPSSLDMNRDSFSRLSLVCNSFLEFVLSPKNLPILQPWRGTPTFKAVSYGIRYTNLTGLI